ncbi:Glycosyl hydrolases family 15 [Nakamurella panacisegetis]|uniref:Glycosyl hydrolases family 15 n=1 Tax=Nakamurella panacisegetis TaxID=1090615 RepID=A0A1H0KNZ3_9ACTN|nr:glycoside hydrolase family 15 protein [Nakamurella panacisegetis]SDO57585.1 Glycosyl hydrolases family 15 [Nakamurella panacisegetis]
MSVDISAARPDEFAPDPDELGSLQRLAARSIELIDTHQDRSGAYPAAPTFSAYQGYAWLRDGSFTAEAMSRWDRMASTNRFHDWVAQVLTARTDHVTGLVAAVARGDRPGPEQMLPTRFTLAGHDGTDDWWDFQTDGYGMWLWAVTTHAGRHHLAFDRWLPAIEVAVDYLIAFGDYPCYDWWEEHVEHQHISTLAAVRAGLVAAAEVGILDQVRRAAARVKAAELKELILARGLTRHRPRPALAKWIGAETVDGSLPACIVPFGLLALDDPIATATLDAVAADLDTRGGVHRFTADVFYGGGQWLILSCLLGWNRVAAGDTDAGWHYLRWTAAHADDDEFPEQVPDHLLHPDSRPEWVQRWGPVARPLLWSHAMYLILADELGLKTLGQQR